MVNRPDWTDPRTFRRFIDSFDELPGDDTADAMSFAVRSAVNARAENFTGIAIGGCLHGTVVTFGQPVMKALPHSPLQRAIPGALGQDALISDLVEVDEYRFDTTHKVWIERSLPDIASALRYAASHTALPHAGRLHSFVARYVEARSNRFTGDADLRVLDHEADQILKGTRYKPTPPADGIDGEEEDDFDGQPDGWHG